MGTRRTGGSRYPTVLQRVGELRFRVSPASSSLAFVHLTRALSLLAFGSYDDGQRFCCVPSSFSCRLGSTLEARVCGGDRQLVDVSVTIPRVTTDLWKHQQTSVDNILTGIEAGKRGFADASAVGAGKTLSALATCCRVAHWTAARGRSLRRHGFLVLVPTPSLIKEWLQQAALHTNGFHLLIQTANGEISSRGRTNGSGATTKVKSGVAIDGASIVVTTLARCRDKPFVRQAGWDFVVTSSAPPRNRS